MGFAAWVPHWAYTPLLTLASLPWWVWILVLVVVSLAVTVLINNVRVQ